MKTKEHGIKGLAYREDRAAEQLGITAENFRGYAAQMGIEPRRMHGQKGSWYLEFEMEQIADLMGLKDRRWHNPVRGFGLQRLGATDRAGDSGPVISHNGQYPSPQKPRRRPAAIKR